MKEEERQLKNVRKIHSPLAVIELQGYRIRFPFQHNE